MTSNFNWKLLPITQEINQKYASHPKCINEDTILPILTNQKMNSCLKEVGDLCDISKEISFHIVRHTFATSVTLTNGVPTETVSKCLVIKTYRQQSTAPQFWTKK